MLAFIICFSNVVQAQNSSSYQEVPLTFRYRGVVAVYINSIYEQDDFYLPVTEIFNSLGLNYRINQGELTVEGLYLGQTRYMIDLGNEYGAIARIGSENYNILPEDFIITELDYYLKMDQFNKLFGLNFSVNFNQLTLDLSTVDTMPVVAQSEREQQRKGMNREMMQTQKTQYPLRFGRDYKFLGGPFIDYNLNLLESSGTQVFSFSNAVGAEFLGGDIQGNVSGIFSENRTDIYPAGLRYRYVRNNSNIFSSAYIGQINTRGLISRGINGVRLTNQPVTSRQQFGRYALEGETEPQSEVELYLNNQLVDYQQASASGTYRFLVPLTYGNTEYSVRIFTPDGRNIQKNEYFRIPFDYLPAGNLEYNLSFGELQNSLFGDSRRGYNANGSFSYGVNNWMTARLSSEYLSEYHEDAPSVTASLNARLWSKYLLSANINSEEFYRFMGSVIYANGANVSLSYDYNPGESVIYNPGGYDQSGNFSIYTPIRFGNFPLNVRWLASYFKNGPSEFIRYGVDFNTRIGRTTFRASYQDQQTLPFDIQLGRTSRVRGSFTYSFQQNSFSRILAGAYLRGQVSYLPGLESLDEVQVGFSKKVGQSGRVQLNLRQNVFQNFTSVGLNFTIDLNKVRSSTNTRYQREEFTGSQSFRGSIAYDRQGNQLFLSNRQMVGQAGTSVRLFVDNDNNGEFDEQIDDPITDPAVRIDRAGGRVQVKNGINYVSQLLPYENYDVEINKGVLRNPLLVPEIDNFSITTDPNQFKSIQIPFYLTGIISGRITREETNGSSQPLPGMRIFLNSDYDDDSPRDPLNKTIRSFSDGSYYAYEIPPGNYNLYLDETQLEFLNGTSEPDTIKFEVEALAQGDFIENLDFHVVPDSIQSANESDELLAADMQQNNNAAVGAISDGEEDVNRSMNLNLGYSITIDSLTTSRCDYQIQYGPSNSISELRSRLDIINQRQEPAFYSTDQSGMYFGTTTSLTSLGGVINEIKELRLSGLAVFQNCSDRTLESNISTVSQYAIQFGAFGQEISAVNLSNRLKERFGIETIIYRDTDGLFKVHEVGFASMQEARDQSAEYTVSNYPTRTQQAASAEPLQIIPEYQLYLGSFETLRRASIYAMQIEEYYEGMESRIVVDEQEQVHLVLDQIYDQWDEINRIKDWIEEDPSNPIPIILTVLK